MIKMIALDFDWTMVDYSGPEPTIGRELIDRLNGFIERGGYAGIVSGRQYWDFQNDFKKMGLPWAQPFPNYLIAREAYIYEVHGRNYKEVLPFDAQMRIEILRLNRMLTECLNDVFHMYEQHGIEITNFFVYGDFGVEIHVKQENAQEAMHLLENFVREKRLCNVAVHRNGVMVTLYHKNAGKGNTLLKAAQHFGIEPHEVLAIGDSYNDLSMIDGRFGFHGGCVGNADEELKSVVRRSGGYVGRYTAYAGVLDILQQATKNGSIE